jgi:hypothetical protein
MFKTNKKAVRTQGSVLRVIQDLLSHSESYVKMSVFVEKRRISGHFQFGYFQDSNAYSEGNDHCTETILQVQQMYFPYVI